MAKIRRNSPCPCGSDKRYKRCCGDLTRLQATFCPLSPGEQKILLNRMEARELTRQQQQGLGRPIISAKVNGNQIIAVGNEIYTSPKWKTVSDFLSDYLKMKMGSDWGNEELKKPLVQRHPILQWYDKCCKLQQKYLDGSGKVVTITPTGAVHCYYGLAYNLYLLEHNNELQQRYIERLKKIQNFQGAYYELIVANCLIRAGFVLELEDETDDDYKHCEFSATSKKTGRKYYVEVKARAVDGVLGQTSKSGSARKKDNPTSSLSRHINGAFTKPADDGELLIFVDVNAPFEPTPTHWVKKAERVLRDKETNLRDDQVAYVFVTNMSYHRHLDSEAKDHALLAHGLGIDDFAKKEPLLLKEFYRRKQKHIDAHNIMASFKDYPNIPTTLDGSMPSEAFDDDAFSVKIGETYEFEDENGNPCRATITTATIDEQNKIMYLGTNKGQIVTAPITDAMLADYRKHPDTFFGVVHKQGKRHDNPFDHYEWLVGVYKTYSRENILKQIKDTPDFEQLKELDHEDLILEYCKRIVAAMNSENHDKSPANKVEA